MATADETRQPELTGTRKKRANRFEQGYAQALSDVRRLTRAKYGSSQMKNEISNLADDLEDSREDGVTVEDLAKQARADRSI